VGAKEDRHDALRSCLEAARREVVRRLTERKLPLSATIQRLEVIDNEDGTGWSSNWVAEGASPLRDLNVQVAIRDNSVPTAGVGLREHLLPLAELLDHTTQLGQAQLSGVLPQETGPDAVLARVVAPLALHYLTTLNDLNQPNPTLVDNLARELDLLSDSSTYERVTEVTIAGVKVAEPLMHRGVCLRPLSAMERGAVAQSNQMSWLQNRLDPVNFRVPRRFQMFVPSALLEMTAVRSTQPANRPSDIANRVGLAMFLLGFDFSSPGVAIEFDRPLWASFGMQYVPFPVSDTVPTCNRNMSLDDFQEVVDLAFAIPGFTSAESTGREVTLYRVLRGCGTPDSGFLDFVTALEAALLTGIDVELSYRFRLYGALFLDTERDADETFSKLKTVYEVRSKLVHGSPVKATDRQEAQVNAADIVRSVVLRSIRSGWPNLRDLDRRALQ
jgi:Apea-like HEPN